MLSHVPVELSSDAEKKAFGGSCSGRHGGGG
jgi:hypothetical protein